jgi:hypothetical protein
MDGRQWSPPSGPCALLPSYPSGSNIDVEGPPRGATGDQEVNATTTARPPQAARPLTDDPSLEAQSVRGLIVALLIAVPFWLLIAALTLAVV